MTVVANRDLDQLHHDFWRDGVAVVRDVLSPAHLALLAQGIDRNRNDLSPLAHLYSSDTDADGYWGDYCNWDRFDEYRTVIFESALAEIVGAVLGSTSINLFHEHVLVKEPATAEVTPWHHDLPYYCLQGRLLASTWVSLDPVPQAVCPRFLAGSHTGQLYAPRKFSDGADYYSDEGGYQQFTEPDEAEQSRIRSWTLEPGDMIMFHMRSLHNAPATESSHGRRRAFSVRWLGDDAAYDTRPGDTSPPYPELHASLTPGDPLPEDQFPRVWTAPSA